jgi:lysozyme
VPPAKKTTPKKTTSRKKKPSGGLLWKLVGFFGLLILLSPFYYGYVLKTFTYTLQWLRDLGGNPHYRTYKNFNISIPSQYTIHGIDVSYAQGRINWPKVRAMKQDSIHISFAFVKATEGLQKVDPYFKRNWREGPKVGIVCGAYHFFRANKNGLWQARFFLQNISIEAGDLPPVADAETLDGVTPDVMRQNLKAFLKQVEVKTKVRPIIYSPLGFYTTYLAGYFNDYPLWLAHYNQADLHVNQQLNWVVWQHSDKANVNGIYHAVDFNAFRGDSVTFRALLVR